MERKRKVFAYITHGRRLLLFGHPNNPEAGIQVPAGTVRPGESPKAAVLREAREETGLHGLVIGEFLGMQQRDMTDYADYGRSEVHERYFYHVRCTEEPPDSWRHMERDSSDGAGTPIPFDFFWVELPNGVPNLIADHDAKLPRLIEVLG